MRIRKNIILITLIIITAMLFTACGGSKEVLSAEDFKSMMTNAGHPVEDVTHIYDAPDIKTILLSHTGDFMVEFVVYDSEAVARTAFYNVRRNLEDARGRVVSHTSVSRANFSRFAQTTEGRFEVLSRVENTIVIILTTTEHRSAANAIMDKLGY